jgi:ribosomal protein L37E
MTQIGTRTEQVCQGVDFAICPHCGRIFVPVRNGVCPHCGYPLSVTLDRRGIATIPAGVLAPPVSGRRLPSQGTR